MPIILPAIWDDKRTEYHRTHKPDKQLHVEGTVFFNDVVFDFYFNQQSKKNTDGNIVYIDKLRGEITVRSQKDGMKL